MNCVSVCVIIMAKEVKRAALEETLSYRGDGEHLRNIIATLVNGGQKINLRALLDKAGLEPTLWALRALPDSEENAVRFLECEIVEKLLESEENRMRYISDSYPFELIAKARSYANDDLNPQEKSRIESREAYTDAMRTRNARWAKIDAGLFGPSLTKAAVETLHPNARLGAYFAITSAHSSRSTPEVIEEEKQIKKESLMSYLGS